MPTIQHLVSSVRPLRISDPAGRGSRLPAPAAGTRLGPRLAAQLPRLLHPTRLRLRQPVRAGAAGAGKQSEGDPWVAGRRAVEAGLQCVAGLAAPRFCFTHCALHVPCMAACCGHAAHARPRSPPLQGSEDGGLAQNARTLADLLQRRPQGSTRFVELHVRGCCAG